MSDTKHTPSGAVGRQYHFAVVEKKDKEIAAIRAAAEKAREALRLAVEARANYELPGMRFANSSREALAALEEVLK